MSHFYEDYSYDDVRWRELDNGNLINFDYGEPVVAFEDSNGWGVAHDEGFSRQRYKTSDDAISAFERNMVDWEFPYAWKQAKHGGFYRHDRRVGVVSVKRAKSGKWYWVASNGERPPKGWFDSAAEAQADADRSCSLDGDAIGHLCA